LLKLTTQKKKNSSTSKESLCLSYTNPPKKIRLDEQEEQSWATFLLHNNINSKILASKKQQITLPQVKQKEDSEDDERATLPDFLPDTPKPRRSFTSPR